MNIGNENRYSTLPTAAAIPEILILVERTLNSFHTETPLGMVAHYKAVHGVLEKKAGVYERLNVVLSRLHAVRCSLANMCHEKMYSGWSGDDIITVGALINRSDGELRNAADALILREDISTAVGMCKVAVRTLKELYGVAIQKGAITLK